MYSNIQISWLQPLNFKSKACLILNVQHITIHANTTTCNKSALLDGVVLASREEALNYM